VNRREFVWTSGAAVTAALFGTPAFAEGKPIKIGYNVATLANPFFQGMTKGVVDASSKTPGVTLLNTNANGDANTQSTMVVDLINQGVDALSSIQSTPTRSCQWFSRPIRREFRSSRSTAAPRAGRVR
jgi:ribose transport system substrate-binding protein